VYRSLDELLEDERVRVVDIAVSPNAQPAIARRVIEAGKSLLCQKPFVPDRSSGLELIAMAEERGVKLGVNQQMRYDEGIAAARSMVQRGWLGEATTMSFNVHVYTDWSPWEWLVSSPRMEILFHSIHYFDAIRSIFGDPELVFSTGSGTAGQIVAGETRSISTLVYPGNLRAFVHSAHENRAGDFEATFRIDGSEGSIRGTIGLMYGYPDGRPDTIEVNSRVVPTDGWLSYPVTTRWLPDAFAGPMVSLMRAISTDGDPSPTATDNLRTIALIEALYASMSSGEAVRPGERAEPSR